MRSGGVFLSCGPERWMGVSTSLPAGANSIEKGCQEEDDRERFADELAGWGNSMGEGCCGGRKMESWAPGREWCGALVAWRSSDPCALFGEVTIIYPSTYPQTIVSKNGMAVQLWSSDRTGYVAEISPNPRTICLQRPAHWREPSWPLHSWVAFPLFKFPLSEHLPLGWETKIRSELVTRFMHIERSD